MTEAHRSTPNGLKKPSGSTGYFDDWLSFLSTQLDMLIGSSIMLNRGEQIHETLRQKITSLRQELMNRAMPSTMLPMCAHCGSCLKTSNAAEELDDEKPNQSTPSKKFPRFSMNNNPWLERELSREQTLPPMSGAPMPNSGYTMRAQTPAAVPSTPSQGSSVVSIGRVGPKVHSSVPDYKWASMPNLRTSNGRYERFEPQSGNYYHESHGSIPRGSFARGRFPRSRGFRSRYRNSSRSRSRSPVIYLDDRRVSPTISRHKSLRDYDRMTRERSAPREKSTTRSSSTAPRRTSSDYRARSEAPNVYSKTYTRSTRSNDMDASHEDRPVTRSSSSSKSDAGLSASRPTGPRIKTTPHRPGSDKKKRQI